VNQHKKTNNESLHEMKRQKPSAMSFESLSSMSSFSGSPVPSFSQCILPSLSKETEELFNEAAISEIDYDAGFFHLRDDETLLTFSDSFNEDCAENHEHIRSEHSQKNLKSSPTTTQVSSEESMHSYATNIVVRSNSIGNLSRKDTPNSSEDDIHPSLIEFSSQWLESPVSYHNT